jgi:predicted DNA-binding transcriptional regulator YafY
MWTILEWMRAGRLVNLLRLLQTRPRWTARSLAVELEVSERTILRDIEALSGAGVPVYTVRGATGGVELLATALDDLPLPAAAGSPRPTGSASWRARVYLSPRGRQVAALLGRPAGVRVRKGAPAPPDRPDWVEASIRIESIEGSVLELLALGAEVEVLRPPELRARLSAVAKEIARLYVA